MRSLLLLISAAALLGQTPDHKVAAKPAAKPAAKAATTAAKNFKETGSPNAPITLEFYTDYQCPACRAFYLEVLPSIMSQYVASGKVRIVHRDYPLPIPAHKYNKLAARYANAAGRVGSYEAVAAQIFKTQPEWEQNGNIDAAVAKVVPAAEMAKIRELVKSDSHLDDSVAADVALGNQDGLNQTPTFAIVSKGKRNIIGGPLPFSIFQSYFDQLLSKS